MLKATGIVRKIDPLGRIVLPQSVRKDFGFEIGTPMELFVDDGGNVILKRYIPKCSLCNEMVGTIEFKGKILCKDCLRDIKSNY